MDKKQNYMPYTGMPCRFIWFNQATALGIVGAAAGGGRSVAMGLSGLARQ